MRQESLSRDGRDAHDWQLGCITRRVTTVVQQYLKPDRIMKALYFVCDAFLRIGRSTNIYCKPHPLPRSKPFRFQPKQHPPQRPDIF